MGRRERRRGVGRAKGTGERKIRDGKFERGGGRSSELTPASPRPVSEGLHNVLI